MSSLLLSMVSVNNLFKGQITEIMKVTSKTLTNTKLDSFNDDTDKTTRKRQKADVRQGHPTCSVAGSSTEAMDLAMTAFMSNREGTGMASSCTQIRCS